MSAIGLQSSQDRSTSFASAAAARAITPICPVSCEIRTRPSRVTSCSVSDPATRASIRGLAGQRGAVEDAIAPGLRRRVPDLRCRRETTRDPRRPVDRGNRRLLAGEVDDADRAAVVVDRAMVEEGDPAAVRRDARVPDPTGGLVQHLSRRKLDPAFPLLDPHDGEFLAVGSPVGVVDVLEERSRGPSGRADAGEGPGTRERRVEVRSEEHSHLAGGRDGGEVGARNSERPRFRAVGPADVDLGRLSVPGRRRQDGLPVGSEARSPDRSVAIGQLLERRRFRNPLRLAHEVAATQKDRRGERAGKQGKRTEARGRGRPRA